MMMLQPKHRDLLQSHGIVVGRSLIGLLFLYTGYGMFMAGPEMIGGYFNSVGVPFPALAYWLVVAVKMLGGLALILGYRVGCAAAALIGFTLLATYFGHSDLSNPDNHTAIAKNLAIVGGLLYVMAFGAGYGWKLQK